MADIAQILGSGIEEISDERVSGVIAATQKLVWTKRRVAENGSSCSLETVLKKAVDRRCDHVLCAVGVPVVGHVGNLVKGRLFHLAGAVHQHPHTTVLAADDNSAVPVCTRVLVRALDPLGVAILLREIFQRIILVQSLDLGVRYVNYVGIVRLEPAVDEIGNKQIFIPVCDCVRGDRFGVLVACAIEIYCCEDLCRINVDTACHERRGICRLRRATAIRAIIPNRIMHCIDIGLKCFYPALRKSQVRVDTRFISQVLNSIIHETSYVAMVISACSEEAIKASTSAANPKEAESPIKTPTPG